RAHASQRFVAGRHHTPGGRRRSPRFSNVWPHRQGRGKDAPTHPLVREPPGVTTFHVKPGAPGHGRLGGGTPNDGVASTAPHEAPTLPGHAGSTWNRRGLGRETAPHTARGSAAPGPQRRTREPTQPHHPLDPGGCKRGLTDLRPQGRSTSEPPGGTFHVKRPGAARRPEQREAARAENIRETLGIPDRHGATRDGSPPGPPGAPFPSHVEPAH